MHVCVFTNKYRLNVETEQSVNLNEEYTGIYFLKIMKFFKIKNFQDNIKEKISTQKRT